MWARQWSYTNIITGEKGITIRDRHANAKQRIGEEACTCHDGVEQTSRSGKEAGTGAGRN